MKRQILVVVCMIISAVSGWMMLWTIFNFMLFVSGNKNGLLKAATIANDITILSLLHNNILLGVFIVTHSAMACSKIKDFFTAWDIAALHRSVYNIATCITLEIMMSKWIVILPSLPLVWNLGESNTFVIICQIFHAIGWFSLFSAIYILDFPEFMGIKQVQYFAHNLGCPLSAKSPNAQNVFKNLRHPVLTSFLVVLWMVPSMSIDRLLFASVLTLYLVHNSNLTDDNYKYVRNMFLRKCYSMSHSA